MNERLSAALSDRYRIERELGAGGMATVYLAEDLKHDRKVAIKVLKPELAAVLGAERFVQEIKTTAAMSHPHILPLFDSGTADGFLFYVMPYLQGETIREKLNRETQFGIEEAVKIASEVAEALHYAHQQGVIHRDIKPENILLHAGRPMVMDFGIALAVSAAAGGRMTETGLSLGTPHYMSPEQATADKQITARSDVYSLASVLYEMLTGEPPHMGNSAQQIVMKIIAEPVKPASDLRKSVPANVAAALMKALEKLPADRFETAAQFAEALRNAAFTATLRGAPAGVEGGGPREWFRHRYSRAASVAVILLASAFGWMATRVDRTTADSQTMIAFTLMDTAPSSFFDISRDGAIAFIRDNKLYVRRAGDTIATEIQGIARPVGTPMFSPDGRDIAVATEVLGKQGITLIVRVPAAGGVATPLFTGAGGFPMVQAWSDDGWIYADEAPGTSNNSARLVRFRETGGKPEIVYPGILFPMTAPPGGRVIVGCARTAKGEDLLIALELETRDTMHLADDACTSAWSPTGHVLASFGDGTLRAIPFDLKSGRATGAVTVLRDDVGREFRLTVDGTLLYIRSDARRLMSEYVMLESDGRRTPLPIAPGRLGLAAFSPDGRQLAYTSDRSLWIYDLAVGTNRQVANYGFGPVWSPDGKRLVTTGERNGLVLRGLGADTTIVRLDSSAVRYATQWLPDGTILASRASTTNLGFDIAAYSADSAGVSRTILGADWTESDARVSPGGRWLAYVSREPDWNQLTVRTWPGLERKVVIADSVATWEVRWSPDESILYYRKGRRLMAATLARGESRNATSHRVVADSVDQFADLHPDGKRFLMRRSLSPSGRSVRPLVGITGWLGELRRKVAAEASRQ